MATCRRRPPPRRDRDAIPTDAILLWPPMAVNLAFRFFAAARAGRMFQFARRAIAILTRKTQTKTRWNGQGCAMLQIEEAAAEEGARMNERRSLLVGGLLAMLPHGLVQAQDKTTLVLGTATPGGGFPVSARQFRR